MIESENETKLWKDYLYGLDYQQKSGLSVKIPQFVKMYDGDQWAKPTENTKNMPRPVVNIIKMICRNKVSQITSTPVKIVYNAEDENVDVTKFNDFADYIQKEMGQNETDKEAIHSGIVKGSYFYHYYWDGEAKGKDGVKEGALRVELIDPLNIFFSNPNEKDEQKQKWIIISSRETVENVKNKADKDVDKTLIVADESNDKYGTVEQDGDSLCTVVTRYFRNNGEVYWERGTRTTIINKPCPLAPDIRRPKTELGKDEVAKGQFNVNESLFHKVKASLYPIVVGNYENKEKSIYGMGEVEGIIPNQKAINFMLGMALFNAQETAWGKYIVQPNALQGQVITNEPGQVIIDYTKTGQGIRKMAESGLSNQPLQLVDTITSLTRTVTGSSEVMTGELMGGNLSGSAIAILQQQAEQPIKELREMFWLAKKKQGKVFLQFLKLYYFEKEFTTTKFESVKEGDKLIDKEKIYKDVFSSSEFEKAEFKIIVEAESGSKSSAAGDINLLDTLLATGSIDIKTYISAYPRDSISNKSEILKGIERTETNQMQVLKEQLETAQKTIVEYENSIKNAESIIAENKQLKEKLMELYGGLEENNT